MNLTKEAKEIIWTLEENNFYVVCPCCGEPILLKSAGAPLKPVAIYSGSRGLRALPVDECTSVWQGCRPAGA